MTYLNAFVGHSFVQKDEKVVQSYLKFFNEIRDLNIGFSWVSAEAAEPLELATKVKRLMKDTNLFIGICTAREATIEQESLSRSFWNKKLQAKQEMFSWKTSDWIIQEIGMAVGKEMNLILVVEEGLKPPGGLQGNLEYITFKREDPSNSFVKILQMIRSLVPKVKEQVGPKTFFAEVLKQDQVQETAETFKQDEVQKEGGSNQVQPDSSWGITKYLILLRHIIYKGKEDEVEKEVEKMEEFFLKAEVGKIKKNVENWTVMREYYKILYGKNGNLSTLESLTKEYSENPVAHFFTAFGFRAINEHDKAAKFFEIAATKEKDPEKRLYNYGEAAVSFIRAEKNLETKRVLEIMKPIASQMDSGKLKLIKTFCEIAEIEADQDAKLGLTEKLLDFCPDEDNSRFSLAWTYSEENNHEISLFHYLKIPPQKRGGGEWNNLGCEYRHLNLIGKSINSYRNSEKCGETLAMSNLAQAFIGAGFLEEAQAICDRAISIENYHSNIGYAISRIMEVEEMEDEKEKNILQGTKAIRDFYKNYGEAIIGEELSDHEGIWQGPDCVLKISIKGNHFFAEGKFEEKAYSASLLAPSLLSSPFVSGPTSKLSVQYKGTTTGHSVKAHYLKREVGEKSVKAISDLVSHGYRLLMIVSESLQEIRVYEKDSGKENKFYTLTRIEEHNE